MASCMPGGYGGKHDLKNCTPGRSSVNFGIHEPVLEQVE